jgi:hypothetical protein
VQVGFNAGWTASFTLNMTANPLVITLNSTTPTAVTFINALEVVPLADVTKDDDYRVALPKGLPTLTFSTPGKAGRRLLATNFVQVGESVFNVMYCWQHQCLA